MAVIGAGWAGCAAAVELARAGHVVHLFEASRQLGGRARVVTRPTGNIASEPGETAWDAQLDNGQHILLGAYRDTLRMMRTVGVDLDASLLRLPLQMRYPAGSGGIDFQCPRLPAPLHLLVGLWRTAGMSRADKMSLLRFSSTARWIDWRLNDDCTVSALLQRFDQTPRVTAMLWRPLCLAALNTPPERASAQVFLNVLRDSLGARRQASDMLLPRVDLSRLFPHAAADFITARGARIHLGQRVRAIVGSSGAWQLATDAATPPARSPAGQSAIRQSFGAVIIATPPAEANRLLADCPRDLLDPHWQHEAITTCYLQYPPSVALAAPFYALADDAATQCWGQFVFDRGQLDATRRGLLAVVISAAAPEAAVDAAHLQQALALQLAAAFANPALRHPLHGRVLTEKRATFSCVPGLHRPPVTTSRDGILRAGDYVGGEYPATLEAAVRSGIAAATAVHAA